MKISKKTLKKFFLFLIIVLVAFYAYNQSKNMFRGPVINIDSPINYETYFNQEIKISGFAKQVNFLSLNDKQIYTDTKGHFEEKLLAPLGYNIIKIKGVDGFGNKKLIKIQYLVKDKMDLIKK